MSSASEESDEEEQSVANHQGCVGYARDTGHDTSFVDDHVDRRPRAAYNISC